jgi:hypothetical protein
MNLTARTVLSDCKNAHALLDDESDTIRFRLFWVAGVALLRAVGHVLQKVDAGQNSAIRLQIEQTYSEWKRDKEGNAIFWEFIEDERNNILKEYAIGFLAGPIDVLAQPNGEIFSLDENLFCPIAEGRYAGEDGRDVMAEAIAWWDQQLNAIENVHAAS